MWMRILSFVLLIFFDLYSRIAPFKMSQQARNGFVVLGRFSFAYESIVYDGIVIIIAATLDVWPDVADARFAPASGKMPYIAGRVMPVDGGCTL
jgi:hypothetical protein